MKKLSFILLGAALVALPALVKAQSQDFGEAGIAIAKVNVNKLKGDIAKSDAEIADPKKNVKSATWIKRGNMFVNVDAKPVNGLFIGLDENLLKLSVPPVTTTEQDTINNTPYTVYNTGQARIYVSGGTVDIYMPTIVIDSTALDKAYEAYDKAYAMDPKSAKKVRNGMENIRAKRVEDGSMLFSLGEYKQAAARFEQAFEVSVHPALNTPDTLALYNAGFANTVAGDFAASLTDLDKALDMGYERGGETFYYKAHDQYALGDKDGALATLQAAVGKYPANEDIIDLLMRFYAENDGDPSGLISVVEAAIEANPNNPGLYQGLARIYNKLGRWDDAVTTIKKAVELKPDDFFSNYWEGDFIIDKANAMSNDVSKMTITSREQYKKAESEVNAVFAEAIAPLEKAHSLDSSELVIVELLKNLTFRLREESPEMNDKYNKYLELYNQMSAK